jgi:hypothetical protein
MNPQDFLNIRNLYGNPEIRKSWEEYFQSAMGKLTDQLTNEVDTVKIYRLQGEHKVLKFMLELPQRMQDYIDRNEKS